MSDDSDEIAGADVPGTPAGGAWPSAPGEKSPEPAPDTGWAPPAPPTANAEKKKSRAGLVFALVVGALVVVVTIVVGIVVLTEGGSFPDDDEKALIRAIPGKPKPSACKAISVDGASAAVSCRLTGGAIVVTAAQFSGIDGANEGFEDEEGVVELSDSSTSDCIDRNKVEHDYETIDGVDGRALCYRKGGRSVIAWTDPGAGTVFRATRNDDDDVQLYTWWAEGIQRRFPTLEELDALKALAPEAFEDCETFPARRSATVAIHCTNDDGLSLYFTQFADTQDMADEYVSSLDDTGLEQGENVDAGTCPFEGAATTLGEPTGRVFCSYRDDVPAILYTDEPSDVLVEVVGAEGDDGDALLAEWRTGAYDPQG